jgi:transporter family protein
MFGSWITYAVLTVFFWGVWGILVKLATRHASALAVYVMSALPVALILAASLFINRLRGEWFSPPYAIIGGILGSLGTITFYQALSRGQAATVVALTALYPAITVILAILVLKEQISISQATGIVLAILAGYLLTR